MEVPNLDQEIALISDEAIRTLTKEVFKRVPDYFWTLPASSSGKYHPLKDRGPYGCVYHTKDVIKFGLVIADSKGSPVGTLLADKVICAAALHDVAKYTLDSKKHSDWTVKNHPDLAADLILSMGSPYLVSFTPEKITTVSNYDMAEISQAVRSHMGRWGTCQPQSELDWIIHLADNIASHNY